MKKILGSIVVMIMASFMSYVPAAKADYAVQMYPDAPGYDTFMYSNNLSSELWWSLWGMNFSSYLGSRPNSYGETFIFTPDYRDNATAYMLSLTPRNDIHSNCFQQGSEWRIEIFDDGISGPKLLATYTYRGTPGTPPEWGTIFNVPLSVVNKARIGPHGAFGADVIQLAVMVTPRKNTRSPLPAECIRSITWTMLMPDWTYQWLGSYSRWAFFP